LAAVAKDQTLVTKAGAQKFIDRLGSNQKYWNGDKLELAKAKIASQVLGPRRSSSSWVAAGDLDCGLTNVRRLASAHELLDRPLYWHDLGRVPPCRLTRHWLPSVYARRWQHSEARRRLPLLPHRCNAVGRRVGGSRAERRSQPNLEGRPVP